VFIIAGPIIKLLVWREGDSGGHLLRETMSRGLCELVCPSRTSGGLACIHSKRFWSRVDTVDPNAFADCLSG